MKLSQIKLIDESKDLDIILSLIDQFNSTAADFPKGKTVYEIFEEQAFKYPKRIAVQDTKESVSYKELVYRANKIALFLQSKGITGECPVALLLDSSVSTVVSILGILKAGAFYLPINPELPYSRIQFLLDDTASAIIISQKKFIKSLNKLQWECKNLRSYLCLDSNNVYQETEEENELMREDLWDFIGDKAHDEISSGAWFSSYTGKDLSRASMNEYGENAFLKLKPLLNKETRILEIGCSSGISLLRIAPYVKEYVGVDISSKILEGTQNRVNERGLTNVQLFKYAGHEIDQLATGDFDIVIMNSVVQCFRGHNYLREVIGKAIALLKDDGSIFLGDIQDQDSKTELVECLLDFDKKNFGKNYKTKTDWSNELFLSKSFLQDLRYEFPALADVSYSDKIGSVDNELTQFRFDAILKVRKQPSVTLDCKDRNKHQFGLEALDNLPDSTVKHTAKPRDLAYIIYTSGSTGLPKGCMVTHENVVRLMINSRHPFDFTESDIWILAHSYSFDFSVWEIFGALLYGGKLIIPTRDQVMNIEELLSLISNNNVTILNQTPIAFQYLAEKACSENEVWSLPHLRYVIFGGDRLDPEKLKQWTSHHPLDEVSLVNMYGITETTVHVTFHALTDNDINHSGGKSPIGRPLPETTVYIFDEGMKMLPVGTVGEIFVGGSGVCRGYFKRPELTEEKYVRNPYRNDERIYKTGDLGRWLADGRLEIVGRKDDQVKIRGFRIELGEIEQSILSNPKIKKCVVLAVENEQFSEKELVAYLVSSSPLEPEEIKSYLAGKLPDYMIPVYYVTIDEIPRSKNGKVEKKILQAAHQRKRTQQNELYLLPTTHVEKQLVSIWERILGRESIGVNQNFFELGGHSLKATKVVSRIHKEMNVKVDLKNIFSFPTIKELAKIIDSLHKEQYSDIVTVEGEYFELSPGQKRLWILHKLEKEEVVYNMPSALEFFGELNINALEKAFGVLVERHEILRTTFVVINKEPKTKVHRKGKYNLEVVDLSNFENNVDEAKHRIHKDFHTPFDLENGPLLRVRLFKLSEQKWVLSMVMHHIISDGWSMQIIKSEIATLYNAFNQAKPNPLSPLRIQYKDYASWINRKLEHNDLKIHQQYWLKQFEGEIPILEIPTDFKRPPIKTFSSDNYYFPLELDLVNKIKLVSKEHEASLFMVLMATINTLLHKYSRQQDIIIGAPIAGRFHSDLENQIGFYLNTLALKTTFEDEETFKSLIAKTKKTTLDAYEHQIYPFDHLVNDLHIERDISRSALFNVLVVSQDFDVIENKTKRSDTLENLDLQGFAVDFSANKFDLTFYLYLSTDSISIRISYNKDLFTSSRIELMSKHYVNLVSNLLEATDKHIKAVNYLTAPEYNHLVKDFNNTLCDYSREETLDILFEEQVERKPHAVALVAGNEEMTYQELNRLANKLARKLVSGGIQRGDKVGLIVSRTFDMIVGIYAVLKADGAYIPIDPDYPSERQEYILKNSGVKLLLADASYDIIKSGIDGVHVIEIANTGKEDWDDTNLGIERFSNDLAYIIYTSGSTGKPKGVMIEHHSVVNLITWVNNEFKVGAGDKLLFLTSMCFDLSVYDIFGMLSCGGTVVIAHQEDIQSMKAIKEMLIKHSITFWDSVPTTLNFLITEIESLQENYEQTSLRLVFLSGDWIPLHLPKRLKNFFPNAKVISLGGATEGTVWSNFFPINQINPQWNSIPYGKPISNNFFYILDDALNPVPAGVVGELYIGGVGVAKGYMADKQKTDAHFMMDPFNSTCGGRMYRTGDLGKMMSDGNMEFLGRKDHQVKVRGYRVELGEIETVLLQHEAIDDVLVSLIKKENDHGNLVAFYIGRNQVDEAVLRNYAAQALPTYMLPSYFISLDKFPLNANGKVDRKALSKLAAPAAQEREFVPAKDQVEEGLVEIWMDVLGRNKISVTDNFFELGGHSLRATQVITAVSKFFEVNLELRSIFLNPTIRNLAQIVKEASTDLQRKISRVNYQDYYELSHAQKRFWLLEQFKGPDYNGHKPDIFSFNEEMNVEKFKRAIDFLINRYEILRTHFIVIDGGPKQKIIPSHDFSFKVTETDFTNSLDIQASIKKLILEEAYTPLDISEGPLLRVQLIKVSANGYYVLYSMHHIITDGWSMELLKRQLLVVYRALNNGSEIPLLPLPIQYKDYAAWHNELLRSEALKESRNYWINKLKGELPQLNLTGDLNYNAHHKISEGDVTYFSLDEATLRNAEEQMKRNDVTLFMVLLAGIKVLLFRYSSQDDITVGSPVAGRVHHELEAQVGLFLNTLPLRDTIKGDDSFSDIIQKIKATTLEAFTHQVYPYDLMMEELDVKRNIFDVGFTMQNQITSVGENSPYTDLTEFSFLKDKVINLEAQMWIQALQTNGVIQMSIEYRTNLFSKSFINQMIEAFKIIMNTMTTDPSLPVSKIKIIDTVKTTNKLLIDLKI